MRGTNEQDKIEQWLSRLRRVEKKTNIKNVDKCKMEAVGAWLCLASA